MILNPQMVCCECPVKRIIFIPVDPRYNRFALILHLAKDSDGVRVPHNHPLPPITKVPKVVARRYQECAQVASMARTVLQVDKGLSNSDYLRC